MRSGKKAVFCLFVLSQQATQYRYLSLVAMAEAWLRVGVKVLAHTEGWFAQHTESSCIQACVIQRNVVGGYAAVGLESLGELHVVSRG